ncbi:MAG: (Fe-S)-binding protein [Candidatus Hydrothermarchaeota archaeon]|nr:(Fe-S)-binding protein [Candidatus Hydrothermarchaeota archaeon]
MKDILARLPGINCGKCGFETCSEMAEKVEEKAAKLGDCVVLVAEKEVAVKINGREVPMGGFVQEIIKKTVLGMISSLKKGHTKAGDVVEIKIRVK